MCKIYRGPLFVAPCVWQCVCVWQCGIAFGAMSLFGKVEISLPRRLFQLLGVTNWESAQFVNLVIFNLHHYRQQQHDHEAFRSMHDLARLGIFFYFQCNKWECVPTITKPGQRTMKSKNPRYNSVRIVRRDYCFSWSCLGSVEHWKTFRISGSNLTDQIHQARLRLLF